MTSLSLQIPEDSVAMTTTTTLSSSNLTDGSGYEYELLDGTDARYECPICLLYLRDPMLTTCGHRFCSACISQWVLKEGGRCPVDGVSLSHENIFPDNYTRREIMQCKAKCPYTKDGCKVVLAVSELERHIQTDHIALNTPTGNSSTKTNGSPSSVNGTVECLYREVGCVSYFPHDQLQRHLEIDVHHHLQLLTAAYKRLKVHSSRPSLEYPSPQDRFLRQDSRDSTRWLLADETVDSDDYTFRRQSSWDSVRYARKYHSRPRCHERLAESDESLCKPEHSRNGGKVGTPPLMENGTEPQIKDIFERLVRLEQNDREKQIKIDRLESQLSSAVNLFSTSTRLMDDITARYCHGVFVWKIPGFKKRCLEMRKNPNNVLNSPGFYTDTFGYKLCLRFNLTTPSSVGGAGGSAVDPALNQDEDTFISLYIHFMQGEFDDTLRWPFHGEMKLTVIHPSVPEDSMTEKMNSKPEAAAFSKPTLPRNPKGFGYPEFCPINKIFSAGFVKNDTLVCKILAKAL